MARTMGNRGSGGGLLIVYAIGFIIDAMVTTAFVGLVADSQVNLLAVFFSTLFNVVSIPFALGLGFGFEAWVWGFIIIAWVGQAVLLLIPLRTIVNQALSFVTAGGIAFGGLVFGGWSSGRAIDTFVAVFNPMSSGVAMYVGGPFDFSAPELGVVAVGWVLVLSMTAGGGGDD